MREIDAAQITVLVDNYTDLMRDDGTSLVHRPNLPDRAVLLAEHGLSVHITVRSGDLVRSFLLDAGGSDRALLHNAAQLGVDLRALSSVVISHGHDDHRGSLKRLLTAVGPLPVYIHPDAFRKRQKWLPEEHRDISPPDQGELEHAGAKVHPTSGVTLLESEMVLVTGEIERSTHFEQIPPFYRIFDQEAWTLDLFRDDQAVVLLLRDKGLIIITGCAHAGIINTIQYARKVTGVHRVHAVIGGFHLSGSFFSPVIGSTVRALKEILPDHLIPMHCTGWEAIHACATMMPEQFILNTVGSVYQFE